MPNITAPKRMAPIINSDGTPTSVFANWAEEVSRDTNTGSEPDQFGEITSVFALMFKADFDVQKINQQLAALQVLISQAQADITTLQGNISVINGQINAITTDISAIGAQISTITSDITSLQSSVAANTASIASAEVDAYSPIYNKVVI